MKKKTNIKWLLKIVLISLVASIVFTLASTEILGNTGYIMSFAILAVFIIVGIVFDVIGDVTGIVSGTTAALIAARLMDGFNTESLMFPVLISAIVTGLTVGGKAIGKTLAFNKSTEIVLSVGKIFNLLRIMPFSHQEKQEKQEKQDRNERKQ